MEDQDREPRVNVRGINPELWRRVRHLALDQGVPVGEIVGAALAEYMARYQSRVEVVKREEVRG